MASCFAIFGFVHIRNSTIWNMYVSVISINFSPLRERVMAIQVCRLNVHEEYSYAVSVDAWNSLHANMVGATGCKTLKKEHKKN
jgi:hypothetical protein